MRRRICVITFHHALNFGAALQAWALCRAIQQLGHDVRLIDYRPARVLAPYWRPTLHPVTLLTRHWRFAMFRRRFLSRTQQIFRTAEELRRDPPNADVFVCGSDQIWNLRVLRNQLDGGFFLDFGQQEARRVAYAPSFGETVIPPATHGEAASLLRRFDALSVREEFGREVVRNLVGRDVPIVLDPTLLVDDYSELTFDPHDRPQRYILAFGLERSGGFTNLVQSVKRRLNMPVVSVGPYCLPGADWNLTRLGPCQWLGWLRGASYVCTNSFHGTAFSIIFRRNFAVFPLQRIPGLNNRIHDLLRRVSLFNRLVTLAEDADLTDQHLQPINYARVEPLLDKAVGQSWEYLEQAVSEPVQTRAGRPRQLRINPKMCSGDASGGLIRSAM